MRKRIMCLILSLCMVAGIVTGCGSSDNVTVTKKLEEEYVERMEAYLTYYQEQDTDTTGVIITLDEDHLPLMWLCYGDDDTWDGIRNIQLLCYKDDKVEVLAERNNTIMIPILSDDMIIAQVFRDDADDYVLEYDEEKKDFKSMSLDENGDFDDTESTEYYEELRYFYGIDTEYYYYIKNGEITYLCYATKNDEYYSSISNNSDENSTTAAKEISYTTRSITQVNLSQEEVNSLIDQINSDSDNDTEETVSRYLYYNPNGEELSVDEFEEIMDYVYTDCEIHTIDEEINEYWAGVEAESLMRTLAKHPAYTTGEMLAVLNAVYEGYSVIDTLDFDSMTVDTTEYDNLKERIIELVTMADFNYDAVDDIADDIDAAYRDSKISPSQFTALENDIDLLYAKLNEAAEGFTWLSAYMDYASKNDLSGFAFADLDNSGVPVLICSGGIDSNGIYKYNGSSVDMVLWGFEDTPNGIGVLKMSEDKSSFLVKDDGTNYFSSYNIYNSETFDLQRAFCYKEEVGYYWSDDPDNILSSEEAKAVYADLDAQYSVEVFSRYYNGANFDTIEEAYNYYLENKDVSYSSSTEETYYVLEIYIKHFEVENGRLIIQVDTEDEQYKNYDDSIKDGLLDMAISSDCIWGSINVGEAEPTESNKSYEEVKKGIDTARSRYVQDGTYEDARGVYIVVKDEVVMKVYTVSS